MKFKPWRRGLSIALALPVSVVAAALAFIGPAEAEIGIVQPITNVNGSGSCLDASAQDDTTVLLWHCHGGTNQLWNYGSPSGNPNGPYLITNWHTATCLDVGNSFTAGSPVTLRPCTGSTSQLWQPASAGDSTYLVNQGTGLCLDLRNDNTSDGTIIQQWPCNLTGAQFWFRGSGWGA